MPTQAHFPLSFRRNPSTRWFSLLSLCLSISLSLSVSLCLLPLLPPSLSLSLTLSLSLLPTLFSLVLSTLSFFLSLTHSLSLSLVQAWKLWVYQLAPRRPRCCTRAEAEPTQPAVSLTSSRKSYELAPKVRLGTEP